MKTLFPPRRLFAATLLSIAFSLSARVVSAQPAAPRHDELTGQFLQLKSGLTLHYVVQGDPYGPVVVLLHGAGDSWHSYERVLPLLSSRYRVYAVTLRGHGLSDHPESGYTRADFAADIFAFLDQLHLRHVTLVGHSLGSYVAQTVAEQDTDRLDRLVLIGSGPGAPSNPETRDGILSGFTALKGPVPYTFARDFQTGTVYSPIPAWFLETMIAEAQRLPAATWHGIALGITADEPVENLKKIRVPTLIFWGDKDQIFSAEDQQALLRAIPHAQLKKYAGTGHALHWERPVEFSRDLIEFIDATEHAVN
jgi:pimeloyl-ACP methyl ester carboxylesterase